MLPGVLGDHWYRPEQGGRQRQEVGKLLKALVEVLALEDEAA